MMEQMMRQQQAGKGGAPQGAMAPGLPNPIAAAVTLRGTGHAP
jgi:hypothetical protein